MSGRSSATSSPAFRSQFERLAWWASELMAVVLAAVCLVAVVKRASLLAAATLAALAVLLLFRFGRWLSLRAGIRQRMTAGGVIYNVLTLTIAVVALHTKSNFLVLLFGMLLSGLLFSFALSRLNLRRLALERKVPTGSYPGKPFSVELTLENHKRFQSSYGVNVWDELPPELQSDGRGGVVLSVKPRGTATVAYRCQARRRGVFPLRNIHYSTRFPFGLFEQERWREVPGEVVVYPRLGEITPGFLGQVRALAESRRRTPLAHGQADFRGLREYRPGDNPRHIHWKSSAKLGVPLVREHDVVVGERALILVDTRAPASGEEALELAISFAASLARDMVRQRITVALAAYAPSLMVLEVGNEAGLRRMLEALARLEPDPRRSLSELVAEPQVAAARDRLAVLVARERDADAGSALETLRGRHPRALCVEVRSETFPRLFQLEGA